MEKVFSPHEIERRLAAEWEARGYFEISGKGSPAGKGPPYCIMLPPPNVTGTLHMGHAFQHTLMDALTRMHRMDGYNTLWQPGTDHAGIATQMVVERQLNAQGLSRREIGREEFVKRVWEWREHSGGTITRQMRRLGDSVAWSRDRFTMDPQLSAAVTEVFVRLHEEGLIYRGQRLVNWDPVLHTALSDLEVIAEEEQGSLWHVRYPLSDGAADSPAHLGVATTRPETILGDTAVAVHPEDERYRHLVGRKVRLPLAEREIPVVADSYVDPQFGSGCVKITPGHDFNDYDVGQRHSLPLINIFTAEARLNDQVPVAYRGLDRFDARKRVVADLERLGLLEKVQSHRMTVPRGDRSGAVLEPWLTNQWYVKTGPLAEPAIRAVEDGRIRFIPENWSKTYFQWMHNIRDWCISRQLWWGHRVPAWYDDAGNIFVGRDEAQAHRKARQHHGRDVALKQDEDVLDTWFSSGLWPFSTLGWPQRTAELETFYPTSVLVTGFDIIFFWVARMIMLGMKFGGDVPFRDVYITGLIRDEHGEKMSKAKGNIIDPIDLIDGIDLESLVAKRTSGLMQPHMRAGIEKATRKQFPEGIPSYGTDALRFAFAALSTPGRDIRFDLGRVAGARNFCNKLWNAARYVILSIEGQDAGLDGGASFDYSVADRAIRSRFSNAIGEVRAALAVYRFDLAAARLHDFTWHEFCDWYLEFSKADLQARTAPGQQRGTRHTLVHVLEGLLRLLHPFMPFITAEIWQKLAPVAGRTGPGIAPTIMLQPYPRVEEFAHDARAEQDMQWILGALGGIRQVRGENNVAPSRRIDRIHAEDATPEQLARFQGYQPYFDRLANIGTIAAADATLDIQTAATVFHDGMKLHVPLKGLKENLDAERQRVARQRERAEKDLAKTRAKLDNAEFVRNAPPEVIARERQRAEELQRDLGQLSTQMERLERLNQG
jgi:valyl-tRNA synthetase